MKFSRRAVLKAGALVTAASALSSTTAGALAATPDSQPPLPPAFDKLKPLGDRVRPVTTEEYQGRVALAQRLMRDVKPPISVLYVTPGTSLAYYTGIRWGLSERLLAMLVPREGGPMIVCPAFEEGRLREQLRWPMDIRVWQEDESPYAVAAKWISDERFRASRVGVEETTRYVFFDGLRKAGHTVELTSGDPVTHGCRSVKTDHELELMRLACEATFDVFRAVFASLSEGMTQYDVADLVSRGFERMGLRGGALVLFGQWAALPHGTHQPQKLQQGQLVLIDGGCSVEGYESDVTRCSLLGKPSDKLLRAFDLVRKAQDAALIAAQPGHQCGSVDDAARQVITQGGFGPGYKYFTHRLGHGIGLDGHEWPYLVRGSRTILQTGMTFSNEPGIYVQGDYGLRLEDDMVISEIGAAQLLTSGFSPSLEDPVGQVEQPKSQ
jgi:Xaa-Pro dipeptidase